MLWILDFKENHIYVVKMWMVGHSIHLNHHINELTCLLQYVSVFGHFFTIKAYFELQYLMGGTSAED